MKKTLLSICLLMLCASLLWAQAPEGFNYQALARDSYGNPFVDKNISVKLSILSGSTSGTTEYSETHNTTTDNLGMFALVVGGGTLVNGNFSSIDWGGSAHFLKVEMDPSGGSAFVLLGTAQLLSVPYALHSKETKGIELGDDNQIVADESSNLTIGTSQVDEQLVGRTTIIGQEAGLSTMSGSNNTLIGWRSGRSLTSGHSNVFLGYYAGHRNTTGEANVYVGNTAGQDNHEGNSNTLIGHQAGTRMTGSLNTAVGRWAGYNNYTGRNNVFMGVNAGAHNNGFNNVMMGSSTGWQAQGNKNVFIGQAIGQFATTSGSVFIGHAVAQNESRDNRFILGNGPDSVNYLMTGDFSTGNIRVRGELETGAGLKFGDGSVLSSATELESVKDIKITFQDVSIGHLSNKTAFGHNNVTIGQSTGQSLTSGADNVFLGSFSGRSNTEGAANVFIGAHSGRFNTSGGGNTYVGPRAAQSATTASHNTLIGNNAGAAVTTGPSNTMVGALAGREQTSAKENTYLGYFAARNVTSGHGNTVVGSFAGRNANGNRNVFIGYKAGQDNSGDNQLIIANGGDSSRVIIEGNFSTGNARVRGELETGLGIRFPDGTLQTTAQVATSSVWSQNNDSIFYTDGNVGIGTTSPSEKLTVDGNVAITGGIKFADGTVQNTAAASGDTAIWNLDSANISYTQGKVGIGTNTPTEQLTVDGKIETTEGIKFADGTVQTTATTSGAGKSIAEYHLFSGAQFGLTTAWKPYGTKSITVPGPGIILVTYTGYTRITFSGDVGIGLPTSSGPLNRPMVFQDNSKGGNDTFTTKYGHRVSSAGTYDFSMFARVRSGLNAMIMNDVTLLYIPD